MVKNRFNEEFTAYVDGVVQRQAPVVVNHKPPPPIIPKKPKGKKN